MSAAAGRPPTTHRRDGAATWHRPSTLASALARALDIPRRHLEGGGIRHRLRQRAARGRDDGKPARQRLADHHAVALEQRRHHEQVGAVVESGNRLLVDGAEQPHTVGKCALPISASTPATAAALRSSRAGDDEFPGRRGGERGERLDEDVIALARHDRADRHDLSGLPPPLARAARSVPGSATERRARATPKRPTRIRPVSALVTTTWRARASATVSSASSSPCRASESPDSRHNG